MLHVEMLSVVSLRIGMARSTQFCVILLLCLQFVFRKTLNTFGNAHQFSGMICIQFVTFWSHVDVAGGDFSGVLGFLGKPSGISERQAWTSNVF